MTNVADFIATDLNISLKQVQNTLQLLDNNTVPFITRYRKEMTGGLNEDQIRAVEERLATYTAVEERRNTILEQIRKQEKLTPQLQQKIVAVATLKELEDIYLPYKPKKRTLATIARERGLGPLADKVWQQKLTAGEFQQQLLIFVHSHPDLNDTKQVTEGLRHIIAEKIAEHAPVRQQLRKKFQESGYVQSQATIEEEQQETSPFRDYFEFSQPIHNIPPHRILALNRGEKAKSLRVNINIDEQACIYTMEKMLIRTKEPELRNFLLTAIGDGYRRLLYPSLCREIRRDLTQMAEKHAIVVFAGNLKKVLLAPPVRNRKILAIDPAFRTGCKLAIIDESGNLLAINTIYPHSPQCKIKQAKKIVLDEIHRFAIDLIAIGNGTAHRETEEFIAKWIAETKLQVEYIIVNEAGASVYSTSKEAQEEFPELDASYRGTISIARRLQDPLAEIVKIDPKSIGVGLYQHDVNTKALKNAVDVVVESCVNYVGVDLNTASVSLLQHVSGLTRSQARNIYKWRIANQRFSNRQDLLKVKSIGKDTFVQAAGFLKIPGGANSLDNTQIHPESYPKTQILLNNLGFEPEDANNPCRRSQLVTKLESLNIADVAAQLQIGRPTLEDIIENLKKPGRDPRDELPKLQFRSGMLHLEDLQIGEQLSGTVRNVVDFGAFVDIGIKEDGLVHISEMADFYVKNPHDILAVGDTIKVWVKQIDSKRRRIALSMRTCNPGQ